MTTTDTNLVLSILNGCVGNTMTLNEVLLFQEKTDTEHRDITTTEYSAIKRSSITD